MNFSLTIQIPAFKKVNFNGVYKSYNKFLVSEQKEIILTRLADGIDLYKPIGLEYLTFFEEHKDKRIHAHIYLKHIDISVMNSLRDYFCRELGIKKDKQQREIFYFDQLITLLDSERWLEYCKKNQNI